LTLALLATLAALSAPVSAPAAPAPPANDNYLSSKSLNLPHTPLDRVFTLVDKPDTTSATVQSNVFDPPRPGDPLIPGGPPEPTSCSGVAYGATVWYDFYPDVKGLVRIRTSGYDSVISLVGFDLATAAPDFAHRTCVPNLATMAQELLTPVAAGRAYTVQIGAVRGAGGPLEFLFDFVAQPTRINADATLVAQPLPTGIRVKSLKVSAPRNSHVSVRCSAGCRPQAKSAKTVAFPGLTGARLNAGARLQIYITAPQAIGAYIEYRIERGSFAKTIRCLEPGSRKPRTTCQ
jgi:hypothetical protein